MALVLIIVLIVVSLVTLVLVQANLKKLRNHVKTLPPFIKSGRSYTHHLVGVNLRDYFQFPEQFDQKPLIVAISSPTCLSCHKNMKDYLDENGSKHPFVCILRSEDEEVDAKFHGQFDARVPILTTTKEFMKNVLRENKTPLWCVLDKKGIILDLKYSQKGIVDTYRKLTNPKRGRKGASA